MGWKERKRKENAEKDKKNKSKTKGNRFSKSHKRIFPVLSPGLANTLGSGFGGSGRLACASGLAAAAKAELESWTGAGFAVSALSPTTSIVDDVVLPATVTVDAADVVSGVVTIAATFAVLAVAAGASVLALGRRKEAGSLDNAFFSNCSCSFSCFDDGFVCFDISLDARLPAGSCISKVPTAGTFS